MPHSLTHTTPGLPPLPTRARCLTHQPAHFRARAAELCSHFLFAPRTQFSCLLQLPRHARAESAHERQAGGADQMLACIAVARTVKSSCRLQQRGKAVCVSARKHPTRTARPSPDWHFQKVLLYQCEFGFASDINKKKKRQWRPRKKERTHQKHFER